MCGGASSQQNQISNEQNAFYQQATQQQSTLFGEQQGILSQLKGEFSPILKAGPSQQGYSAGEKTALDTSAIDNSGNAYQNAETALNDQYAGAGGGSEYVPSGAQQQMDAGVAEAGAQQLAGAKNTILQNDYTQGNQNFNNAASTLSGVAGQYNPIGQSSAATGAGSAASNTANQIASQNNAWEGVLGGAAGSALGGWASGGFKA